MTDDRRMTADRFYGGVTNRLENLQACLTYIQSTTPTREQLTQWIIDNTRASSEDAVSHHLNFLDAIDLIELDDAACELATYGEQWLKEQDPQTLYTALTEGVKGFDTILEALYEEPQTDTELMDLLVSEFDEAEMTQPGPAIRHREWLQVLGYAKREGDTTSITDAGREALLDDVGTDHRTPDDDVETTQTELRAMLDTEPQLTSEDQFTEQTRRVRDQAFARLVKAAYDNRCAICGTRRETPAGTPEVEAAHIYPKSEQGADDPRNGLALCKLHHWAFDTGWLAITDAYEILVADAPDRAGYHELKQLEGKRITLPDDDELHPHTGFLAEHRELHGF